MNRLIKFSFLVFEIVSCYVLVFGLISFECFFQKYFHIACPACGLTRAFREFIKLNFVGAVKYNFLSIPIFLLIILVDFYLVYDIIFGSKRTELLFEKLGKHTILILIILGINMIINNLII